MTAPEQFVVIEHRTAVGKGGHAAVLTPRIHGPIDDEDAAHDLKIDLATGEVERTEGGNPIVVAREVIALETAGKR